MVLLRAGERDAEEAGAQNRGGVAEVVAGRHPVLCETGRAAKESWEDAPPREECGDAILAEKRDSLRGDGGCGHG